MRLLPSANACDRAIRVRAIAEANTGSVSVLSCSKSRSIRSSSSGSSNHSSSCRIDALIATIAAIDGSLNWRGGSRGEP